MPDRRHADRPRCSVVMRFLFGTDGSPGARIALDFLCALPLSRADHVSVVTVPVYSFIGTGVVPEGPDLLRDRGLDAARAIGESARAALSSHGVPVSVDVRNGPVVSALELVSIQAAADIVVVGSRGLGVFTGTILGSVARALARHASMSVLVVRERRCAPQRVLLAIDGSQEAWAAVKLISHLPLPAEAQITALKLPTARDACHWPVMDEVRTLLSAHAIEVRTAEEGHLADSILAGARTAGADLVVLGSRGMTAGSGVLQGSLADQVLSQAHCAVLVAKPPMKPRLVTEGPAVARIAIAL
jgi:nucleotide-binding universal stress UspA family protein